MTDATVTLDTLIRLNACMEQRQKFEELFGDGVTVTRELCQEHAAVFDWDWVTSNLLTVPARRACGEAVASAQRAYDEAVALAFADAFLAQVGASARVS